MLFEELGATTFQQMYRMHLTTFMNMFHILEMHMNKSEQKWRRQGSSTPNGPITTLSRLSMALRFCADGDKYDTTAIHGVNPDKVCCSLWRLVDAFHTCKAFNIFSVV